MLRRLSTGLLATVSFVAPLTATAQEGSTENFGVKSISHEDVVKPTIVVQSAPLDGLNVQAHEFKVED